MKTRILLLITTVAVVMLGAVTATAQKNITFKNGGNTLYSETIANIDNIIFVPTSELTIGQKLQAISGLTGLWEFNCPDYRKATVGDPLETYYVSVANNNTPGEKVTDGIVTTGTGIHEATGFDSKDGAIRRDDRYQFKCTHNIPPTELNSAVYVQGTTTPDGNYDLVGNWTIVWDILRPAESKEQWNALLNTHPTNKNDADVFISQNECIGITGLGYSYENGIKSNQWYRVVVVMDAYAPTPYAHLYVNGVRWILTISDVTTPSADKRHYLMGPYTWLLGDNDGNTPLLHISTAAIFNRALSKEEIESLGGFVVE